MYVREQSEKQPNKLTFAVSGKLWNRSLVMIDSETKTLWSHILGEAMQGELKGTVLETLPSTMVDWKTWKTDHPDTTVLALSRTSPEFLKEFHHNEQRFVLGLRTLSKSRSYGFDTLKQTPVINDVFDGEPVVVVFRAASAGGRAFLRTLEGNALTFETKLVNDETRMKDQASGSLWNPETGLCEQGQLKGKRLTEIPAVVSFRGAWQTFYPEDERYQGK